MYYGGGSINVGLLLEHVEPNGIDISNRKAVIKIKTRKFDSASINKILEYIKYLEKIEYTINVVIDIKSSIISDHGSLVILEMIVKHILENTKHKVKVRYDFKSSYLGESLFKGTILYDYTNTQFFINREKYIETFNEKILINKMHFRKLFNNCETSLKTDSLSKFGTELNLFTTSLGVSREYADMIIEISQELVDNAIDHTSGDCIFYASLVEVPKKKESDNYKLLNITVANISEENLGSGIIEMVKAKNFDSNKSGDRLIKEALGFHEENFNDKYDLESFCLLSAFQKSTTTRKDGKATGGMGLTTLIKGLSEKAYKEHCYALSGNKVVVLKKDYLNLDENGLIGFNEDNDYLKSIPDLKVIRSTALKFSGTIYNLSFLLEGELNE